MVRTESTPAEIEATTMAPLRHPNRARHAKAKTLEDAYLNIIGGKVDRKKLLEWRKGKPM
jgi:hypothetical protein